MSYSALKPDVEPVSFIPPRNAAWLDETNEITRMFLAAGSVPGMINIAGGLPESDLFPKQRLAKMAHDAMLDPANEALQYPPIDGLVRLRDCIAKRFSTEHLELTRDNVLILSGGMQGLDLIGKALLDKGDTIAAQSPAYLGAIDAWKPRYPRYATMFPSANGFNPADQMADAKFAYTVPNFSNPTGKLVGTAQRETMLDAAYETGTWILEDDPYGALYYDHAPLPRMLDLAARRDPGEYNGPVLYMGTLSKEVAPGLRVGWLIGPKPMIETLAVVKQGSDMCTSGLSQLVALQAFESGLADDILPAILECYRHRRDALFAAMEKHLTPYFDFEKPVGGMFIWAMDKTGRIDTDKLVHDAWAEKVCVSPSSVFDPQGDDKTSLRINFTFNDPDVLDEGIKRLASACQKHLDQ